MLVYIPSLLNSLTHLPSLLFQILVKVVKLLIFSLGYRFENSSSVVKSSQRKKVPNLTLKHLRFNVSSPLNVFNVNVIESLSSVAVLRLPKMLLYAFKSPL